MDPKKYFALMDAEGTAFAYFYAGQIRFNDRVPLQTGMWEAKPGFDPEDILRKAKKITDTSIDHLLVRIQKTKDDLANQRKNAAPQLDWQSDMISRLEAQIERARKTLAGLRIVTITVEPWPLKP